MKTIKAKLIIDIEMQIDDYLASEETLRYLVEQDLEDCGFDVNSCEICE